MGKDEGSSAETKAQNILCWPKENRSGTKGEVGEGAGGEEGGLEGSTSGLSARAGMNAVGWV
jgi:hypothetical protein